MRRPPCSIWLWLWLWLWLYPCPCPYVTSFNGGGSSSGSMQHDTSIWSRQQPLPLEDRVTVAASASLENNKCEPITIQFCQNIEYNQTIMPNLLNHEKQSDAAIDIHSYLPALKVKCSPDINFFLCSLYAPVCTILDRPIPPCRSLCLNVKNSCESFLNKFGLHWPDELNCEKFPIEGPEVLCINNKNTNNNNSSSVADPFETAAPTAQQVHQPHRNKINSNNTNNYEINPLYTASFNPHHPPPPDSAAGAGNNMVYWNSNKSAVAAGKSSNFVCPDNFKVGKAFEDTIKVGDVVAKNCGIPCGDGMFFNQTEIKFSRMWVASWSCVCASSSLFTILTFLIDPSRFRYPERPVIFLSVCYLLVSSVYLLGFALGDEIACRKPVTPPSDKQGLQTVSTVSQGTKGELCTISFIGLYYFGMASILWWVILALSWFLAAGRKWGHEAIEANSQYFHLIAWAVPAIKTISILATGKIEGDVLTGVCNVGLWNRQMLHGFVLLPLLVYLTVGTVFFVLAFASLFHIREAMKHEGSSTSTTTTTTTKTDKLEKLMLRVGIFTLLFTIPAVVVVLCLVYEQINFDQWMVAWHRRICHQPSPYVIKCPFGGMEQQQQAQPIFYVFMAKYLCVLMSGISVSVWMWSRKTVSSWKELLCRIRGKKAAHTYV